MDHAIAQLSHVTLRYDDVVALDDVSLDVAPGEWLCVLGANGSGKSTLASVLAGLLAPDEGSVELAGERVLDRGRVDFAAYGRARRALGLVFQNPDDQMVTTVVEEDVAFGPENLGLPPDEIGLRVERELERVEMTRYAQADPTRLSGGQKQRVAIAGALAMEPQILVLDEPGASLDVRGRNAILRVMRRLHDAGTTLVHITHFMDEALDADRVVVMERGRIACMGTPHEVFGQEGRIAALGLEEPFAARVAHELRSRGIGIPWTCSSDELRASLEELVRYRAGAGADAVTTDGVHACSGNEAQVGGVAGGGVGVPGQGGVAGVNAVGVDVAGVGRDGRLADTALEARHVAFSYADDLSAHKALEDVSLRADAGCSVALVGQTGSGKSTLLRLLCALEVPDSGEVLVGGVSTTRKRDRRRIVGSVGYVMQHPERQLFAETVAQDVAFGPRNLGLPADEVQERVARALELVGLTHKAEASPFELSGGQRRLAAIAGVLAMQPHTLVLDEPTAGLDPRGRAQLRAILRRVHARGTTVVEVTHSMDNAAQAEELYVLNEGTVLLQGTPHEVFSADHEELLRTSGLGVPEALAFARQLNAAGWQLGEPLSSDELVDALVSELAEFTREARRGASAAVRVDALAGGVAGVRTEASSVATGSALATGADNPVAEAWGRQVASAAPASSDAITSATSDGADAGDGVVGGTDASAGSPGVDAMTDEGSEA